MNYFSKTRVEAFSDGVFAIIVTLLVLEIKVPLIGHHESVTELSKALYSLLPKLIGVAFSFVSPWLSITLFTFIPFYFIFFNTVALLAND